MKKAFNIVLEGWLLACSERMVGAIRIDTKVEYKEFRVNNSKGEGLIKKHKERIEGRDRERRGERKGKKWKKWKKEKIRKKKIKEMNNDLEEVCH